MNFRRPRDRQEGRDCEPVASGRPFEAQKLYEKHWQGNFLLEDIEGALHAVARFELPSPPVDSHFKRHFALECPIRILRQLQRPTRQSPLYPAKKENSGCSLAASTSAGGLVPALLLVGLLLALPRRQR
jgi:hypothetical protein